MPNKSAPREWGGMSDQEVPGDEEEAPKRIFPRATKNIAAWFAAASGQFQRCVAVDFGAQGACLELEESFPEQESVEVCFELDSDWVVRAKAKKIWERQDQGKFFTGITYKPLRSSDKHLIGPWIHRMRKAPSEEPGTPSGT